MARFRSKEARVKELEDKKTWLLDPNLDLKDLNRRDFEEFLVFRLTGELDMVFSEDMTSEDLREIISLYEAGETEQAEEVARQCIVGIKEKTIGK